MTRPRDHLGLVIAGGTDWLDELRSDTDAPLVTTGSDRLIVGDGHYLLRAAPDPMAAEESAPEPEFVRPYMPRMTHPPLRVRPSAGDFQGDVRVTEVVRLGSRITLVGDPDLQAVGEAFHRFFACDNVLADRAKREAKAAAMLSRWGVPEIASSDLVDASNRLSAFLGDRFGDAPRLREWSVQARDGLQMISGRIDLLVELADGFAVIDHKSFPGSMEMDAERLRDFAGQVQLYSRALSMVAGRVCREFWLHQPIVGTISRVELRSG
jgi:hypothetical protein